MKNLVLLSIPLLLFSQSCNKPVNPEAPVSVTSTVSVPQVVEDFFVFDTGQCWVYQDSLNPTNFDTIELVSKASYDYEGDNATLYTGYRMRFRPQKTDEFWIYISTDKDSFCHININPVVSGACGELQADLQNGKWVGGVYYDSIRTGKTTYHNVLYINQSCCSFLKFIYSKNFGLVSYVSWGLANGQGGGVYKLVKMFKK